MNGFINLFLKKSFNPSDDLKKIPLIKQRNVFKVLSIRKKMKRGIYGLFALLAFSLIFAIPSASALMDVGSFITNVIQSIESIGTPIFSALFGIYQSDEFLFAKILLFVLLFILIKIGIKATPKLGEKPAIVNIISLVISLFAIRYISENDLTRGIFLPYGTLGVAIATLLPFVIYFFFVEKTISSGAGRKMAWLLFVVIFSALWFNRVNSPEGLPDVSNYIYMAVVILGVILFFFDKAVKKYFDRRANYASVISAINRKILDLQYKYDRYINIDNDIAKEERKKILKQIKELEDEKHKYS